MGLLMDMITKWALWVMDELFSNYTIVFFFLFLGSISFDSIEDTHISFDCNPTRANRGLPLLGNTGN